jgi:hypothetical protein
LSRDLDKAHKVGQGSKVQLPNDGKSKAKALAEAGISTRASRSAFAQATVQPTLCGGTLPAVWMRDGYDHYPLKNFAKPDFSAASANFTFLGRILVSKCLRIASSITASNNAISRDQRRASASSRRSKANRSAYRQTSADREGE